MEGVGGEEKINLKETERLSVRTLINTLANGTAMSKARSNDLFWVAVWPRFLARSWHSDNLKIMVCDLWTVSPSGISNGEPKWRQWCNNFFIFRWVEMVNKAPAFFKVFIAESNSIDVAIPVSFTERMERAFPERVFLRDRHHHIWIVKIAKVGNYWYFVDGWDKFVKDYRLLSGDIMVFEYFSDYLFNVKVYGPFSTEKRVVSNNNREEPIEHNDMDCADHHEEEGVENDRDSSFTRRGHNNEDDEDEVTDDADYMPKRRRVNEDEEVVQDNVNNNNGASSSRSTKQSLKYLYPRCYGMEIFEAGLAKQPKNPYFVTKILPKRRADLFIPMDVIKDHELQLSHEIILVDPNGREFNARCRQWSDGRSLLSGGWSPLCSVNLVTPQDSCICEFVPRKGDPRQFLHVSFVRAD